MQRPSVGRIVQYRLRSGPSLGQYRPAIIVRVWNEDFDSSAVQLQVFTDGENDGLKSVEWATSVLEGTEPGTYRWPPFVPPDNRV